MRRSGTARIRVSIFSGADANGISGVPVALKRFCFSSALSDNIQTSGYPAFFNAHDKLYASLPAPAMAIDPLCILVAVRLSVTQKRRIHPH